MYGPYSNGSYPPHLWYPTPQYGLEAGSTGANSSTSHINDSRPYSPQPPTTSSTSDIFVTLRNKSTEELQRLLSNQDAYNAFLHSSDAVKQIDSVWNEMVNRNVELAKQNLEKESDIFQLKNQTFATSGIMGEHGDGEQEAATHLSETSFFKKSRGNKNMRKRPTEEEEDEAIEEEGGSSVLPKTKSSRIGDSKLVFSSQQGPLTGKKSAATAQEQEKKTFFYESSREIQTQSDSRATAILETETEFDKDARAIREKVLKQADDALRGKNSQDENVYKGIHGYTDHKAGFRREHTIAGEKAGGAHGPLRASAHIRWSVRFDYQPDICKDYKETGYCGYGDACKFMHDRGDYKSGWQMDREWEETEKKRKAKLAQRIQDEEEQFEDEDIDDSLPFACMICRQPFIDPVVTSCKHYFCEHCALKHHARNKHCFVCNKPTNGTFNTAHEILKKAAAEKDEVAGASRQEE